MHTSVSTESTKGVNYDESKAMLEERRQALLQEVQTKLRSARLRSVNENGGKRVDDPYSPDELNSGEEIEFALLQMKCETLNKINDALVRLEEGTYGYCFKCGEQIDTARLRALPFAGRCRKCQGAHERKKEEQQRLARLAGQAGRL